MDSDKATITVAYENGDTYEFSGVVDKWHQVEIVGQESYYELTVKNVSHISKVIQLKRRDIFG